MNEDLQFTSGESGAESMLSAIQDRERQYTEEELYSDLDWIEASGKIYQMNNNGEKFQGDHKALAKYGIDQMSEFNYNMSMGMIPDVMAVEKADNETQIAFAYMMDTYDKKDVTLNGVGRAFKELALDPLSYVGISTLGAGFAAKQGAEQVAKAGLKNRLHASIRNYLTSGLAVGATEGALYTAGDTTARQSVMQDAGLMEGYDPASIATSAGLGAVAGGALAKGAEVVGKQIGKGIDYISQSAQEEMAKMAGGGTPRYTKLTDNPIYSIKPTESFSGEVTLLKDKNPAPKMGSRYGQDVEPSGYYAIQKESNHLDSLPNYETVKADIKKPLIVDVSNDVIQWKRDLSSQYKAKGKRLTEKLIKDGYDSIITTDKNGATGEIIILDTSIIQGNK